MNPLIQQMVNQKINSLTKEDLLSLSVQYQMPINEKQAEKVINILRSEKINIADEQQCKRILYRLQTEVDPYVSSLITQLLVQYTPILKTYGIHL